MLLFPTTSAIHLTGAGLLCMTAGAVMSSLELVQVGGAIVLGVFGSRALGHLSVTRARASGFEMLWHTDRKLLPAMRLEQLELWAELQNRDGNPTEFRELTVLSGPGLKIEVSPRSGVIPPRSRCKVRLEVTPLRVGVHGIFGVALETIRAPGLFQAPLVFPNSLVLEVSPRYRDPHAGAIRVRRLWGAISAHANGAQFAQSGDFRELREHRPGDPYHSIAWKASARRGKLLVVDHELGDIETNWVIVDVSQELLSGRIGQAPLDTAIDRASRLVGRLVAQGGRIGLVLVARRVLARVPPARGSSHARKLLGALGHASHGLEGDRSGWSLAEVENLVREHLRFLAPDRLEAVRFDLAEFLKLLEEYIQKAPWPAPDLNLGSREERILRRYLLAYGIQSVGTTEVDRPLAEGLIATELQTWLSERRRPTAIHIFARWPGPETPPALLQQIAVSSRLGVRIAFHPVEEFSPASSVQSTQALMAQDALRLGAEVRGRRAAERLKQLGVLVEARAMDASVGRTGGPLARGSVANGALSLKPNADPQPDPLEL